MKENEAPEKIYIPTILAANTVRYKEEGSIEYIRKDAFIEKACEYLKINLWRVVNEEPDFRQRFVTDFRNYMKGE